MKFFLNFLAILSFAVMSFGVGQAHVFHTSLTRIDYNSEAKTAEISLRVFINDLEDALSRQSGKRINLERDNAEAIRVFNEYISKGALVLRDKNGKNLELKVLGFEAQNDMTYCFIEADAPDGLEEISVKNTIFFDFLDNQTNIIVAKNGTRQADLLFKLKETEFKKLVFREKNV